jgi:hypothetical protein
MTDLFERLRQRKVVQWSLAYAAFAFALLRTRYRRPQSAA